MFRSIREKLFPDKMKMLSFGSYLNPRPKNRLQPKCLINLILSNAYPHGGRKNNCKLIVLLSGSEDYCRM